jgi:hypothetical protein
LGRAGSPDALKRPKYPPISRVEKRALNHFCNLELLGARLAEMHDELAAKGLLIRIGREAFKAIRKQYAAISALGSIDNRLKPIDKRFIYSLKELAKWFSCEFNFSIWFERDDALRYRIVLKKTKKPLSFAPFFLFGFLEEFCTWLDARKAYNLSYIDSDTSQTDEIRIAVNEQD